MHKAYLQNLPPTASYGCLATKKKPFAYAGKGLYTKENSQNYSKTHSIIFAYNQLLVVWNICVAITATYSFCTAVRQVSRLKDHRIRHLPGFPVISRPLLPNYGDEFVQDLHLFPFSPEPIICKKSFWSFRHLTATYSIEAILAHFHLQCNPSERLFSVVTFCYIFLKKCNLHNRNGAY